MNFNVELYIIILLFLSMVFSIIDVVYLSKKRKQNYLAALQAVTDISGVKELSKHRQRLRTMTRFILGRLDSYPEVDSALTDVSTTMLDKCKVLLQPKMLFDYSRSLFPVFLLVVIIRSFMFEPFLVPTGSLEPTVLPGDFLLVSKYSYGLRIPLTRHTFYQLGEPKNGDIVVFRYPPNSSINYVKRVVGVPGDRVSYIDKVLYINGVKAEQRELSSTDFRVLNPSVREYREDLGGVAHDIFINKADPAYNFKDLMIPQGYYFMMGDNRDNSLDSRFWGFVPEEDLIGKAAFIWLSKVPGRWSFRWTRFGRGFAE